MVTEIFHYQYSEAVFQLGLSSIGRHLYLCICQPCLGHMSLTLKFDQGPISGCRDIPLSIFGGCLPIKVVFHGRSSSYYEFVNFPLVTLA